MTVRWLKTSRAVPGLAGVRKPQKQLRMSGWILIGPLTSHNADAFQKGGYTFKVAFSGM